jgi:replication-associated recombination protein RarA
METKNLKDLVIEVSIRSSEADMRYLVKLANVIVTSLQTDENLDVAFIETNTTEKIKFDKKLRIFSGTISL